MASHKELAAKVDDLIVATAALAGVRLNNPETNFKVRLAITQAQQDIVGLRRWKWMNSTGVLHWSASQSTVNMYSASAGMYSAFGGFRWLRVRNHWPLHEMTGEEFNERNVTVSTSQRPTDYWRFGEASLKFWPIPTAADSAAFGFRKRAGFVHTNGDVLIPKSYHWNVLLPMARRYIWDMVGDDRATRQDRALERNVAAMIADDVGHTADGDQPQNWDPHRTRTRPYSQEYDYSGFYETGNLPS